jgi:GxxExxY protein
LFVVLKALDAIHPIQHAQVMNHLRATNLSLGLLINFHTTVRKDGIQRIVVSH